MMLQRMESILDLHMLHGHLLLSQVLFLSCHQELLLLFTSLQRILLLSCQGRTETWETAGKRGCAGPPVPAIEVAQ